METFARGEFGPVFDGTTAFGVGDGVIHDDLIPKEIADGIELVGLRDVKVFFKLAIKPAMDSVV